MDTQSILAALESQLESIDQAITALRGGKASAGSHQSGNGKKGRRLSAAARKRISAGMKRRWAERKKKAA